jgi:hypothetical protein
MSREITRPRGQRISWFVVFNCNRTRVSKPCGLILASKLRTPDVHVAMPGNRAARQVR